jgi:TP901 family phage tail tape measure protein
MAGEQFQAVIAAVDDATSNIRRIAEQVKGLQTEVTKTGDAEKKVGHHKHVFAAVSGQVDLLRGHFGKLRTTIGEVGGRLADFAPMLAGLAGIGSASGLFEMANGAAEAAAQLEKSAKILGMSAGQFDRFAMAAKLADVPVQTMQTSMQRLGYVIGQAAGGQNKQAAVLFAHLGIKLKDAHGHMLSVTQALPQLANAFAHTADSSMRLRMAEVLFGRTGQELIPMLRGGAAELAAVGAVARSVDFVPNKGAMDQLDRWHKSWILLGAAASGFRDQVGSALAPTLQPVIDDMRDWIVANKGWIATDIGTAVRGLGHAIKTLMHTAPAEWLGRGARALGHFLGTTNGTRIAVAALAAAMGPMMLVSAVKGVAALGEIKEALIGMQAVAAANPLYLIAAAVAGGAVLIYEYWGPISSFFKGMWGEVKKAFHDAWQDIAPVVDRLRDAVSWVTNSKLGHMLGLGGGHPGAHGAGASAAGGSGTSAGAQGAGMALAAATGGVPLVVAPRVAVAGSGARVHGKVETTITLKGAPPGTRVESKASGAAASPQLNVGYAAPAFGF